MKRLILLTTLSLFVINFIFGQDHERYSKLIKEASCHYEKKEYQESGHKYSEAFKISSILGKVNDRFNAACSWALANQVDSAFIQLFEVAGNNDFTNLLRILKDPDLKSLHNDLRFVTVIRMVQSNEANQVRIKSERANIDKALAAILDTIHQEDQEYRFKLNEIEKKFGKESDELKSCWKIINEKDSINLITVKRILDDRGWLGPDIVGEQGADALFLVIQHSDLETQIKYLPMLKEAVKIGDAKASNWATMIDRVALWSGEKQIYGTQLSWDEVTGEDLGRLLVDPENVDKRRLEVGILPLQEFFSIVKELGY